MPATTADRLAGELSSMGDRLSRVERGGGLAHSSIETPTGTALAADALRSSRSTLDLVPLLASGWALFSGGSWAGPSAVRHTDGLVSLAGLVATSSVITGTLLTLPDGWRPAADLIFLAACETDSTNPGSPGVARLNVLASGDITVSGYLSGTPSFLSLSGIAFPTT